MTESQHNDDDKLASLLLRWEEAWDHGDEIPASELCADCPDLVGTLQQQIDVLKKMAWMKKDASEEADEVEPTNDPLIGKILSGRYRIEELISEGGFGRVYRGYDSELQRHVAIKVSKPERITSPEQADDLLEEARRAAKLRHPGIVAVHDVGRDDGQVFIVSDLIDGQSLAEAIETNRPTPTEAARLIAEVADALQFAHDQGFVHFDIKPPNILIDKHGRPLLTDFGIAASAEQVMRGESGISGTPPYMAPEQVAGEAQIIDARTDIHALGVVLYEILTGRLPYQSITPTALREQIILRQPEPPRSINAAVPKQIEAVCLRALAKHPADRFANAEEMATALRSPLTVKSKVWHWVWLLVGGGVLVFSLLLLLRTHFIRPSPYNKGEQSLQVWRSPIETTHAPCIAYSPNGRLIAVGTGDGSVRLLDSTTGKEIRRFAGHRNWVRCLAWSPDGKAIVSGSGGIYVDAAFKPGSDHSIRIWSVNDGRETHRLTGHVQPVLSIDLDWNRKRLVSASGDITIRIWDLESGREIWQVGGATKPVCAVAYDARKQVVFSAGQDGVVRSWNIEKRRVMRTLTGHEARIWGLEVSPNGQLLVTASADKTAKLWTIRTGTVRCICDHPDVVRSAAFSPDGSLFDTGCMDGAVRLWDTGSGQLVQRFTGHLGGILCVAYSKDGRHVASSSNDGTVRLWRVPERQVKTLTARHEPPEVKRTLVFDGSSRIVTPLERFAPVTLEAWVRPDRYEDRCHYVIGSDVPPEYGIGMGICPVLLTAEYIPGKAPPKTGTKPGVVKSKQSIPIKQWSHIAVVFGDTETRLYFNGKLVETGTPTKDVGGTNFVIGNVGKDNPIDYFLGQIRSVRISKGERYKGDFTPEKTFSKDASAKAVLIYDGQNADGNRVIDLSGNGNDGRWERLEP